MSQLSRRAFLRATTLALAGFTATTAKAGEKLAISQYGQFMGGFPWLVALKQGFR